MPRTRPLNHLEIRVVGALMEKEQATPEQYPMTVHALRAACNQKTNREPVMSLSEAQVLDTLESLRQDVLVWRTEGARVQRWQHSLNRRWELDGPRKAVMTLLLLRGPQTPGELRARADRLHTFHSLEEVQATLDALASGFDALVRELPRVPGQRETRFMHITGTGGAGVEGARIEGARTEGARTERAGAGESGTARVGTAAGGTREPLPAPSSARSPEALAARVAHLEEAVAHLAEELAALKAELGADR